jgi:hypothetical protein
MKLRIRGNCLRLRVSRTELLRMAVAAQFAVGSHR